MDNVHRRRLEELSCGTVIFDCDLARYTSFAIGGPADALVVLKKRESLAHLLRFFHEQSLPWRVLGKGSNVLVRDEGFRGVVIILGEEFTEIDALESGSGAEVLLSVGAGCSLTKLNHHCGRKGYAGLAFSYGIPGTVGGAVLMNAGAWGKDISQVVTEVGVITADGYENLSDAQLDFGYRHWPKFAKFDGRGVIVDAKFSLTRGDSKIIEGEMKHLLQRRKTLQPHNYPNGGSCFKNPKAESAGRLIEGCGLKGELVGGAMVSEKHANFIVNYNKATAEDVLTLISRVQQSVSRRCNVNLEPEIHVM